VDWRRSLPSLTLTVSICCQTLLGAVVSIPRAHGANLPPATAVSASRNDGAQFRRSGVIDVYPGLHSRPRPNPRKRPLPPAKLTERGLMSPDGITLSLEEGRQDTFWVIDFTDWPDSYDYYQTTATLRKRGLHCYVYLEDGAQLEGIFLTEEEILEAIRDEFDYNIYDQDRATFGSEWTPGIDGDPRITILVMDIVSPSSGGGMFMVAGYFNEEDEQLQSDLPPDAKSNEREMFYMNAELASLIEFYDTFYYVLAHEFQHMIHWNYDPTEELWINEGCAELAAEVCGYGSDVDALLSFAYGYDNSLTVWEDKGHDNVLEDYGAGFYFMEYMKDKYGGWDTVREIVQDPLHGIESIESIAAAHGYNQSFSEMFANWIVANHFNDPDLGWFAYYEVISQMRQLINELNEILDPEDQFPVPFSTPEQMIHSDYPVGPVTDSVGVWAANYAELTGSPPAGEFALRFDGTDTTVWRCQTVTTAVSGANTLSGFPLDSATQAGQQLFGGVGTTNETVTLVIANCADGVSATGAQVSAQDTASYTYSTTDLTVATHELPVAGYYMISFPLALGAATVHDVLSDDLGDGSYYMWRWQDSGYEAVPTSLPESGETELSIDDGYWLLAPAATLDAVGGPPGGDQAILLQSGWNMVAAPYEATMDSLLAHNAGDVRSLAEAQAAGWLLATFYYSHDGTGSYSTLTINQAPPDQLSLWHAYWVLAGVDCWLIFPEPVGGTVATRAAQVGHARPAWAFDIEVTTDHYSDSITIAAADAASDGFDGFALDRPKPPAPPGEGRLRMVLRGKGRRGTRASRASQRAASQSSTQRSPASQSSRASPPYNKAPGRQISWDSELAMETKGTVQDAAEWQFTVAGGVKGETVRLSWPELSRLPKDRVAILTDRDTGRRIFMRSRAQYEFAAPGEASNRSFAVTVKPAQQAGLLISSFSVVPLRAGRGAELRFGLSADATVDISVLNVAGRVVQRVREAVATEAGSHTITWTGRSMNDTALPNGTYLCVLRAKAPDGQQARAVRPISLGR